MLFFSRLVGAIILGGFRRLNYRLNSFLERNAKNDGTGVEADGLGCGCSRELRYNTTEGVDLSDLAH